MNMPPKEVYSSSVQATIEQLRYWVPTIKDVAHVLEGRDGDCWLLSIDPHIGAACPVAIALKDSGQFDISVAGETYTDRMLAKLDDLVLLLDRITQGQVIQRRWFSAMTGLPQSIDTLVDLGGGQTWCAGPDPFGGAERRDRHFLPYRRL